MLVLAAFGLAATSAGCGGRSGPPLRHDDVAVVGTTHISKSAYAAMLARAEKVAAQAYSPVPETSAALSTAAMTRLVADAEQTDAAIKRHTTVERLRARAEAKARVGPAVRATFIGFLPTGPRRARETRMILLYDRPVAQKLFAQLSVGNDAAWCALAMHSIERAQAYRCGTALVTSGELKEPVGRLVFSIRRRVPTLVHSSDGYWTILEAVSPIYDGGTKDQVNQLLLTQSKTVRRGRWETKLARGYCTGTTVSYRHGYQPDPDPTACPQ